MTMEAPMPPASPIHERWMTWITRLLTDARQRLARVPRPAWRLSADIEPAMGKRIAAGLAVMALLVVSFGGWAAATNIAGAVIASGSVVVDSHVKKVQHPTGGIVSEILVRNGDTVEAGQVVMRLDDTQARANIGLLHAQMAQLIGRKARLEAEREQLEALVFPAGFDRVHETAAAVAEGERRFHAVRLASRRGQVAQLRERIGQLQQEIVGLTAQYEAKGAEIKLMQQELERMDEMRKKDLLPSTRFLAAQRDITRLKGEWGALLAQKARSQGQISETELQILNVEQTAQTEASKELREVEARLGELAERAVAAEDQLRRIELKAPQGGIVHDLNVHTVGGIVAAGETLMSIVPNQDILSIEVRIASADIDQVALGHAATLRFPAFNQRTTPTAKGTVSRVGADLTKETQSNASYFLVRISLDGADRERLRLIPGMPVEAFIATGERTALSYLMKPVSDQFSKAFRER